MIRACGLVVVLCVALSAAGVRAQQCSVSSGKAVVAEDTASTDAAQVTAQAPAAGKKKAVDEKTLMEIKRQLRLMREEMAELEEKIDRMTSIRETDKGKYRE
jgi:long-subunit fatty acid transport protein